MKKPVIFTFIIASMSLLVTGCSENSITTSSNTNNAQINVVDGVYSAYFNDYNDLSLNLINDLTEVSENLKQTEEETTASIIQFLKLIKVSNSIKVPQISGENLKLRQKEDYYSISVETKDFYNKPWIFFSFDDGDSNSYVKITNVSSEIEQFDSDKVYELMTAMDPIPDDGVFYPPYTEIYEETIDMNDKSIDVLFAKRDNDPRVYANFIYDDSMVIICCSEENIESGFLNNFGLVDLEIEKETH